MSLTTELLAPITSAAGLYPALHTLISQVAMPNMVARQFLQQFSLQNGNSVAFAKQSGSAGAVINEVMEGSEILQDVTAYNYVVVTPYKVGQGFLITRETIEDSLLPLQQDQLMRLGLRVANKIDKDCVDTISAAITAQNTITAGGKSLGFDGSEFTVSGSGGLGYGLGYFDIIDAKKCLETGSYMPDTLFVSPKVKPWIEKNPWFSGYMFLGRGVVDQGIMQVPGSFGSILGLDAYCSVNCTGSTNDTIGLAYILSRGRTTTLLGQYAPLGHFVEREKRCKTCGKTLKGMSHFGRRKYCSFKCYGKAKSEMIKGSNNPKFGRNKGKDNPMFGRKAWNNGQTKETNEIIKRIGDKLKGRFAGDNNPSKRPEVREKIRKARLNQKSQVISSLDRRFEELLRKERITGWVAQYPSTDAYTVIDFAFPNNKVAIYCDGDYWHNRTDVKRKDNVVRNILKRNGWTILRFWEYEINENPDKCILQVKRIFSPN